MIIFKCVTNVEQMNSGTNIPMIGHDTEREKVVEIKIRNRKLSGVIYDSLKVKENIAISTQNLSEELRSSKG